MKLDEFRDRLDALGADLTAWPDAQRVGAEHLLATEPAARGLLSEAQRLDRLIGRGMEAESASQDAAAARVLATLARPLPPQRRGVLSWAWPAALLNVDLAPSRLRLAALGGVACLGVALGLFGPDVTDAALVVASAQTDTNLAAVFEPEPLTGVRP
jgi:hypothetical protein